MLQEYVSSLPAWRLRLLAKCTCPVSSRYRALQETPSQFLLDLQQDHDGQDDHGSHESFLRLAELRPRHSMAGAVGIPEGDSPTPGTAVAGSRSNSHASL
jgi:hypothetical protein